MQTNFLVIGSGIAGLTYALKVAQQFPTKKVMVLTKTQSDETNTKYAQQAYNDTIKDTLIAGDGLYNKQIVAIVAKEGVERINELIEWGAQFDKDLTGDYKLGKEGAHRAYLHSVNSLENKHKPNLEGLTWNTEGTSSPKEMIILKQSLKELKLLMSDYFGIVRNNERLHRAMKRLDLLFEETEEWYKKTSVSPQLSELCNMITVAYLIVKSAQLRHESRGLHYTTDFPQHHSQAQNTIL